MRVVTTCATKYTVSLMVPRDRTRDGGSVFYGGPDRTISGHEGACDDDRYFFLGVMEGHVRMGCITS